MRTEPFTREEAEAAMAGCPYPEREDISTSSDDYARRFSGPVGEWMLSVQTRALRTLLKARPGVSVLDVGGGHGQLARPLAGDGQAVTVFASHPVCRRRIADLVESGRVRFETGDVLALPFPDRSFDVVVAVRMLTHTKHWPVLVGEMCRVARDAVLTDYPTRQSLNAIAPAFFNAKKKIELNTRAWTLFRHAEVDAEFAHHGFARRRRIGQFFLPMAAHRLAGCRAASKAAEAVCRTLGLTRRWGSPVVVEYARQG